MAARNHPVIVVLCLALAALGGRNALADPICESWPEIRDTRLTVALDAVLRNYDAALQRQELWLEQFDAFVAEGAVRGLKAREIYDVLLLGASVTGDTVALAARGLVSAAGNGTRSLLANLERLRLGLEVAQSGSVDEAAYRLAGEKSGVLKKALSSLDIFKSLIEAKDRFADRKETIKVLQEAERSLRRNLEQARKDLAGSEAALRDLNTFKNELDSRCGKSATNAEACIERGLGTEGERRAHVLTNTCDRNVYLFWCYEGRTPRHDKPCGGNEKYFRYNAVLSPGGEKSNFVTMPASLGLKFGACYGGQGSAVFDGDGGYSCKG